MTLGAPSKSELEQSSKKGTIVVKKYYKLTSRASKLSSPGPKKANGPWIVLQFRSLSGIWENRRTRAQLCGLRIIRTLIHKSGILLGALCCAHFAPVEFEAMTSKFGPFHGDDLFLPCRQLTKHHLGHPIWLPGDDPPCGTNLSSDQNKSLLSCNKY